MNIENKILNELKAILVNYPEQRVDLEEDQKFTILEGDNEFEYEDSWEDYDEWCDHNWCGEDYTVNSIYINENDELSFDLTKNYSDCNGGDEEDLKNVTIDFICDESDCDLELQIGELMAFVNSHKVSKNGVAIIPEGTTEIGEWAFALCDSLKSVTIPESVTSIGDWAFANCTSLKSITIPESVTKIKEYAFRDCTSLETIIIPKSVTEIGKGAFYGCTSLTTITLPTGVDEIGDGVFEGCDSIATIFVPAGKVDYYKERLDEDFHDNIVEIEK